MTKINSHIQMPKCVLKNFMDNSERLYYYSFETQNIIYGRAASFNTESAYYSQETENYLRDNVETPFGKIMKFVKDITVEDNFVIPDWYIDSVRTFIYALLSRGEVMQKSIKHSSTYFQFYSKQVQHDYAAVMGIEFANRLQILNDWQITFMVNDSKVPFVLPLQGFYEFSLGENKCNYLNLPISPSHAITFIPKAYVGEYLKDGMMKLFHASNTESINFFNKMAFLAEEKYNQKYIISNKRKIIELLVEQNTKRSNMNDDEK